MRTTPKPQNIRQYLDRLRDIMSTTTTGKRMMVEIMLILIAPPIIMRIGFKLLRYTIFVTSTLGCR